MVIIKRVDVADVVQQSFERAKEMADGYINFSEAAKRAKSYMMGSKPVFAKMPMSYGYAGWAAILSVDLRGSSARAVRLGAKSTFITMQTYLATMAWLVGQAEGSVIGLRGDGLFAAFGFKESVDEVSQEDAESAVRDAAVYGRLMIKAVASFINPTLCGAGIGEELRIGVGIGAGQIVITRIGWEDAQEITAYGEEINRACKVRAKDEVVLTGAARDSYPSGPTGKAYFLSQEGDHKLVLPDDVVGFE